MLIPGQVFIKMYSQAFCGFDPFNRLISNSNWTRKAYWRGKLIGEEGLLEKGGLLQILRYKKYDTLFPDVVT